MTRHRDRAVGSKYRKWWTGRNLNPRRQDFQSRAVACRGADLRIRGVKRGPSGFTSWSLLRLFRWMPEAGAHGTKVGARCPRGILHESIRQRGLWSVLALSRLKHASNLATVRPCKWNGWPSRAMTRHRDRAVGHKYRKWWTGGELNSRHRDFQSRELACCGGDLRIRGVEWGPNGFTSRSLRRILRLPRSDAEVAGHGRNSERDAHAETSLAGCGKLAANE